MPVNKQQARAVVDSPVFDDVFDEFERQIFKQWLSDNTEAELVRLHLKASIAREVKQQLKNTVVDIHGNASIN